MDFNWPPPKNGQDGFFSRESFQKYSVQPTFIQQLVARDSAFAKFRKQLADQSGAESSDLGKVTQEKLSTCDQIARTTVVKEDKGGETSAPSSLPKSTPWWKLPVPFPRPSWLTREEQRRYLSLYQKFQYYVPSQPTSGEMHSLTQFKELQLRVVPEQEEFARHMETVVMRRAQTYETLHPDAFRYMQEFLDCKAKRVLRYPRYYVQHDSVSLTPPKTLYHLPLTHTQELLHLGEVMKVALPKMDKNGVAETPKIDLDYTAISTRHPSQPDTISVQNKQVCSEETTCEVLARKHSADIVISSAGLKCLLDNQPGPYPKRWELPIVVKEYTEMVNGSSQKKKVVYIDKPFVQKSMTPREKNTWYHKIALKASFVQPQAKGVIDLTTWRWQHRVLEESTAEQTLAERQATFAPVEDLFAAGNVSMEMEDLETFGVGKKTGEKQKEGSASKVQTVRKSRSTLRAKMATKKQLESVSVRMEEVEHVGEGEKTIEKQKEDSTIPAEAEPKEQQEKFASDASVDNSKANPLTETGTLKEGLSVLEDASTDDEKNESVQSLKGTKTTSVSMPSESAEKISMKEPEPESKQQNESVSSLDMPEEGRATDQSGYNEIETLKNETETTTSDNKTNPKANQNEEVRSDQVETTKSGAVQKCPVSKLSDSQGSDSDSDNALLIDTGSDNEISFKTESVNAAEVETRDIETSPAVSERRMSLRPRKSLDKERTTQSAGTVTDSDASVSSIQMVKRKRGRPSNTRRATSSDLEDAGGPSIKSPRTRSRKLAGYSDDESNDEARSEVTRTDKEQASGPEPSKQPSEDVDRSSVIKFEDAPASPEPETQAGEDLDSSLGESDTFGGSGGEPHPPSKKNTDQPDSAGRRKRGRPPKIIKLERDAPTESSEDVDTGSAIMSPPKAVTTPLQDSKMSQQQMSPEQKGQTSSSATIGGKRIARELKHKQPRMTQLSSPETPKRKKTNVQPSAVPQTGNLLDQLLKDQNKMFEPSQQQQQQQQQQLQSPPMPAFLSPPRSSSQPLQPAVEQAAQQCSPLKSNTSTIGAAGNPQKTTDPLGRGEDTSGVFSPKHQETNTEVAEAGVASNPCPSSSESVIQEPEWQMTEDPKEYVAPSKGSNLTYNLWSLGNLKLLVRCSYHGNQRHLRKPNKFVMISPKLEYLAQYGAEQVTYSEGARDWVSVTFRHQCDLVRARINALSGEIITLERLSQDKVLPSRSAFNPAAGSIVLHGILDKLHGLKPGQYLLSHTPNNQHATIKKTTSSTRGVYDLHLAYTGTGSQSLHQALPPWVPIDPSFILPYHRKYGRIPATFEPKDSALHNTVSQRPQGKKPQQKQVGKKTGGKQKKKKRKR